MTNNDPTGSKFDESDQQHQGSARKNRGVRFSDPEWEEVKEAAQTLGVTPAEFVRDRILGLVRNEHTASSVSVPSHLAPLIERTFRYSYMVATKMRDDMNSSGKGTELDKLVSEARALQDSLLAPDTD